MINIPIVRQTMPHNEEAAIMNRHILHQAGVFTLNLIGGSGCGKTALIDFTLGQLHDILRIGVIAADPDTHRDADRMVHWGNQVVQVETGQGNILDATHVQQALTLLNLNEMDVLFIENISSLTGPPGVDLGEDVKVGIFCIADGDDKAGKYPEVTRNAGLILLNKIDLLPSSPFNRDSFYADIRRLNPSIEVFETSVLQNQGMDPWLHWLKERITRERPHVSNWFG